MLCCGAPHIAQVCACDADVSQCVVRDADDGPKTASSAASSDGTPRPVSPADKFSKLLPQFRDKKVTLAIQDEILEGRRLAQEQVALKMANDMLIAENGSLRKENAQLKTESLPRGTKRAFDGGPTWTHIEYAELVAFLESFDDAAMDAVQELGDDAEVQTWFAEWCAEL